MVAPRKKKHSINQLLLRRAVSRTKPSKLPVSAAQGGLPLYHVYEPRCGISVRPSIARDSHLVHIMQSSLPSKARKIRSRRNFRSSPHRNTERMSSEGGKKIKTLLQPWRKLQHVAMPSSHSMKPRSRASSVGYPSSWNFETPRNENVIIMQEHNQLTRKPLGRFNDSSIQCTLKSSQTGTRSKGSAQTQTTLDPDLPTENSSQMELNSHQLQQRQLSPSTIAEMKRLLIRNPWVSNTSRKPEMQPHRVLSGDASYSIPSYQKKKNYGGYTPSEVSSETMRKSLDIENQPSERLGRIEKISLPPSTNGRKSKVNHWNSGMKCACAATISRKRPACNCDKVKKPGGTWRLRLASRDELKSYEEAEMVDTCPISCGENRHTMDLSQWDQGIRPSDPYKNMRRSGQYKENELSENSQDSEHSASEMDANKSLMRTGVPEHRSSSGLSKRNVGFEHGQFNCCQCANAETQTLRKGSMAGKSSKETDCNCTCDDKEAIAETEQELPEDTALKSPKQSDISSEERGSRSRTSKKSLDSVKLKKSTSKKSLDLNNSSRKSFNGDKSRKSSSSVDDEDDFENRKSFKADKSQKISSPTADDSENLKSYYGNKPRKIAKSTADDFKNRKLNYGDKSQNSSGPTADNFGNRKSFYGDKSRKSAKSTVNDDENRKSFYGDKSRKNSKSVANDFENKIVYGDKSRNSPKSTVNDFENRKSFNEGKSRKSSSPTDKGFANSKSFYGDKSRKSSSPTADDFENRKSFYGNKSRKTQDSSPTADDFENRKSSYKDKSRNSASPTADDFRNSNTTELDYANKTCEYPQCPACCCWNQCWNNYPTCLYNQSCYGQQDAMKNNYQNRNNYQMTCKCATATTQTSYTSKVLQKNRKDAQQDPRHASEPDDPQRNRRVSYTGSDSSPTSQEPTPAEVDNASKNSVRNKVPIDSKNDEVKCNCKCPNCGILFNTKPNTKADKISTNKRNSNARPEATTISDSNQIPVRPTTPQNTTVPTPLTTRTMIGSDKQSNEFNNNISENCRTNPRCIAANCGQSFDNSNLTNEFNNNTMANCHTNPRCIAANCGQSFDNSNQFNNSNVTNAAIDENCNVNQIIEILQKTVVGLEEQKKILSQAVRNLNTNQNNSNNLAEDFLDENDEGNYPHEKDRNRFPNDTDGYTVNKSKDKNSKIGKYGQQSQKASSKKNTTKTKYADCYENCPGLQMNGFNPDDCPCNTRRRSGSAYPSFEKGKKYCYNTFNLGRFLNTNRSALKNILLKPRQKRREPTLHQIFSEEPCLQVQKHSEFLNSKNLKYLDVPKQNSYERNILMAFEQKKAALAKCKEQELYYDESSDCEDPEEIEESCWNSKYKRRQKEQSEQTDLSIRYANDDRDSSDCGLAFCRARNVSTRRKTRHMDLFNISTKYSNSNCGCNDQPHHRGITKRVDPIVKYSIQHLPDYNEGLPRSGKNTASHKSYFRNNDNTSRKTQQGRSPSEASNSRLVYKDQQQRREQSSKYQCFCEIDSAAYKNKTKVLDKCHCPKIPEPPRPPKTSKDIDNKRSSKEFKKKESSKLFPLCKKDKKDEPKTPKLKPSRNSVIIKKKSSSIFPCRNKEKEEKPSTSKELKKKEPSKLFPLCKKE
ncbi:uncharacterized protein LOC132783533 isoform X1 [Drosophila nasuta]|uniref:uncharacterized protein LOC132783533 isoform X1 n=1 Tax=Drosophila nasuta TaxID=42062 RepID=UPI00295EC2CF|nr:uncharacterized protein LOC132783533 isoform X1 [Drosophila nasuta]